MKKTICLILLFTILFAFIPTNIKAETTADFTLYAKSAVLIDASNNRILYGQNENEIMSMASTTKIMTLVIALKYGNEDDVVTVSPYAASQPDVQLNVKAGEQYYLRDLLYAMMLKSYNDVAVAIAEYIGEKVNGEEPLGEDVKKREAGISRNYVSAFADLMNECAFEKGCEKTYFITPNGLDAENENGIHSTTAYELAKIAAYAITIPEVEKICTTKKYDFCEIAGKRNVSVYSTDRFLDMYPGAIGLKTGFTGKAGYCFVGAVKQEERTFVSVVLASGWPPHKNYKWSDTVKLMDYATHNFYSKDIFKYVDNYKDVSIQNGMQKNISTYIPSDLSMLLSENERVSIKYEMPEYVKAPIKKDEKIGTVNIYINDEFWISYSILSKNTVNKINYYWTLKRILSFFTL